MTEHFTRNTIGARCLKPLHHRDTEARRDRKENGRPLGQNQNRVSLCLCVSVVKSG